MNCFLAAVVVAGLCSSAFADSHKEQKARADKLFEDGRRYLANKEYALACTAFEQSYASDPALGTELNIALCYEDWGHVVAAYHAYQDAQRIAQDRHDARRKTADQKVAELGPKVPRVGFDLAPGAAAAAVFLLDGKELDRGALTGEIELEPGPHALEARVPGKEPRTTRFDVDIGEHKRVPVDLPAAVTVTQQPVEPSRPPGTRDPHRFHLGIGLVSIGGAAVVAAGTVALFARADNASAKADCPGGLCETRQAYNETNDARTRANEMSIVTAAGVAVAAVGVYFLLTDERKPKLAAAPLVGPNAVGLTLGGGW
jgi:tetratricopeptide (TPR) repeat protein